MLRRFVKSFLYLLSPIFFLKREDSLATPVVCCNNYFCFQWQKTLVLNLLLTINVSKINDILLIFMVPDTGIYFYGVMLKETWWMKRELYARVISRNSGSDRLGERYVDSSLLRAMYSQKIIGEAATESAIHISHLVSIPKYHKRIVYLLVTLLRSSSTLLAKYTSILIIGTSV